jgi:colicin import membrane protein
MKRPALLCLLGFVQWGALAQSLDIETARGLIQDERQRQESLFSKQESDCYLRFAVTDCLKQLRVERRLVMGKLRHQEVLLNDQERKQKGLEQMEVIRGKSSPEHLESESLKRADAVEARKEREKQAQQKAEDALLPRPVQDTVKSEDKALNSAPAADAALKNKQIFERKLKEAQAHRASNEKSQQEKSAKPKKPLPVE